ncbi:MAG: hypothetical protein D6798_09750 [Deltaproteobacteria bacterium]|nr:MAG: hypothetical protein D6798_09750 [Deltaproteobacteria bacterium]
MVRAAWGWWLRRTGRQMDARILALLRILVCLCVVADLLRIAQLGLVDDIFRLYEDGGINAHPDRAAVVIDLFGPDGGILTFWVTVAALTLAMVGLWTRPALLVGILAHAQLGHLYNPGDRGIDRILRTVLLILLFSGAHRRFALGLRLFGQPAAARVPAWPADLVRWLMVMVYLSAGIAKIAQQPAWLGAARWPVVYRIMTDPMAGRVDPVTTQGWWWLWTLMGFATIAVELGSPLLLTRFARYWSLLALSMHAGIFLGMDLGMFSLGMASLHVLLLAPWLLPLLDSVPALRNPALRNPALRDPTLRTRPAAAPPGDAADGAPSPTAPPTRPG